MSCYIALDGGTSNTRLRLLKNGVVVSERKRSVGAGSTCEKNSWGAVVAEEILQILEENGLAAEDVSAVIGSGMLTSEYGLFPLPHVCVPAGISELASGCAEGKIEGISIPAFFIPGVKRVASSPETSDMMRGEETEIVGLLPFGGKDCIYVLPGTHSKHVQVDAEGRIVDFTTFMTGEMIGALAKETILRDAVTLMDGGFDPEALLRGYDCAVNEGLSAALFKIRIMKNLFAADAVACYSFYLGALLSAEILHLARRRAPRVLVAGKPSLRLPTEYLLQKRSTVKLISCPPEAAEGASALGAVRICEKRGKNACGNEKGYRGEPSRLR